MGNITIFTITIFIIDVISLIFCSLRCSQFIKILVDEYILYHKHRDVLSVCTSSVCDSVLFIRTINYSVSFIIYNLQLLSDLMIRLFYMPCIFISTLLLRKYITYHVYAWCDRDFIMALFSCNCNVSETFVKHEYLIKLLTMSIFLLIFNSIVETCLIINNLFFYINN